MGLDPDPMARLRRLRLRRADRRRAGRRPAGRLGRLSRAIPYVDRPFAAAGRDMRTYVCHPRISVLGSPVCDGITCGWMGWRMTAQRREACGKQREHAAGSRRRGGQPEEGTGGGRRGGGEPGGALFERGAITRTFDTPGFRGMTFYEVQAKSIVSQVPASSRCPFTWTINPYRGCQHACVYCLSGDTPILMADGTTKPLADVRVGDAIYGTVRDGYLPPLRDHDGARALVHGQARLPDHAGGRHPAGRQRRPPLPDRARLEARDRRGAGAGAAAVPHHQQQADGLRRLRGAAEGHPSLTVAATCAA